MQSLSNQRAEVGQRVTLQCSVPTHPEPDQVRWYRNEVFLELSRDYQPAYHDGVCSLTIPRVGPQHAGKYSCVVVIRGIPNSTAMHLEVYSAPPPARPPVSHITIIIIIIVIIIMLIVGSSCTAHSDSSLSGVQLVVTHIVR